MSSNTAKGLTMESLDRDKAREHFIKNNIRATQETFQFDIYIAGNYDDILRACRKYTDKTKFCVSISKIDYVYHFGQESGAKITIINYPRFPRTASSLKHIAEDIAYDVMMAASQGSFTIVGKHNTWFYSRREFDESK